VITPDATLGEADANLSTAGAAPTETLTTINAAAAGTRIIVAVSYWASATVDNLSGITIGGVAAVNDVKKANGSDHFEVWSLIVAAGLASSSLIVASFATAVSAGVGGVLLGASSWNGITGVDTTSSATTTGTNFASGSASNALADSLFYGGAGNECASTSEPGSMTSGTQLHGAWNASAGQGFKTGYIIATSTGSRNVAGTWTNTSTATTGALVIYRGTAAPAQFSPMRMPLGV
jgi:hypothetical protein